MVFLNDDFIVHYGVKMRSGRYPYGSGENDYQRSSTLLSRVNELKKNGLSTTEIAKSMGMNTPQFRSTMSEARYITRIVDHNVASGLRKDGLTLTEIADKMGYNNASSIKSLLDEGSKLKMSQSRNTANMIKDRIDSKGMVDVGAGVEKQLGISREKMNQALFILEQDGYKVYTGAVKQANNADRQTILKVAGPKDMKHADIYKYGEINSLTDVKSFDDGATFKPKFSYPSSLDINRVKVKYADEGGDQKDGLIEIRRNVDDISLGESQYAQVRILVDKNKYMKGMAVYSDDIPDGYDMVFNTNKFSTTAKRDVFKDITDDPDNPFGALVKEDGQRYYIDKNGKEKLSPINKCREEGDWDEWSKKLPAQFLAKQDLKLVKTQLNETIKDSQEEFNDIMSLTNPVVRKHYLKNFAESADKAAVTLKASAFPAQTTKVIIPVKSLKDNEVYDPTLKNGDTVALVRFPHGGTFEIPVLKVNNKNKEAQSYLSNTAIDAIGINKNVADKMSGADFDGDFVLRIKVTDGIKISSRDSLEGLKDFDPKMEYPEREGMKYMKNPKTNTDATQSEMGKISNLITDMNMKGATDAEMTQAVKHSMVVIDAAKHKLDYTRSAVDNNIAYLKEKYQSSVNPDTGAVKVGGASTLISRSKNEVQVERYKGNPNIDPKTGKLSYTQAFTDTQTVKELDYTYDSSTGAKTRVRTKGASQMSLTDDAYTLSSGRPKEQAYANYANNMKALANLARKEMVNTPTTTVNKESKKKYAEEVASLNAKLMEAETNRPKERMAQILTSSTIKAKKESNPDMTKSQIKKATQQALDRHRQEVGAKRKLIEITPKEWEAISNNAISDSTLSKILTNSDADVLRSYATPKTKSAVSTTKQNRIAMLSKMGYTISEIAQATGLNVNTVNEFI